MNQKSLSHQEIEDLINQLNSEVGADCRAARRQLADAGKAAEPMLLAALAHGDKHQRWEVIKVLEDLSDPETASAIVRALEDESVSVRWAAMNALIGLDRAGLKPLFTALTQHLDSTWLRQGAHHILHVLKDRGRLYPNEVEVFEALEGPAPDLRAPWAAEKVLLGKNA